jgi:hypothetical protein
VPDDPVAAVLSLVMDFHRNVSTHVEGIPDGDGLIQQLRTAQDKFRKAIRSSAPDFRPYKRPANDEEKEQAPKMPDISFLAEEGAVESDASSDRVLHEDDISKLSQEYVPYHSARCNLINPIIIRAVTRELPGNVPFIVKRKLIKRFVELWDGPTVTLLEDVERILSVYMRGLVDTFFRQHNYGGLHNAVG